MKFNLRTVFAAVALVSAVTSLLCCMLIVRPQLIRVANTIANVNDFFKDYIICMQLVAANRSIPYCRSVLSMWPDTDAMARDIIASADLVMFLSMISVFLAAVAVAISLHKPQEQVMIAQTRPPANTVKRMEGNTNQ